MDADLKLSVEPISEWADDPQYAIFSNFSDFDVPCADKYIHFSGYFGKFGPHMFASAPELLAACIEARVRMLGVAGMERHVAMLDDAIAKAEGTTP